MKLKITYTKPVDEVHTLRIGDVFLCSDNSFKPIIAEFSKFLMISSDTDDWSFKDFFHYTQHRTGDNASLVESIEVMNINDGSDRITLRLKYDEHNSIYVILKQPEQ